MRQWMALSLLLCAAQALAQGDKEVWITLDGKELEPVLTTLRSAGGEEPVLEKEREGVAALRVSESQLELVSKVMHEQFNKCAGFILHDSRAAALAALEDPTPQQAMTSAAVSYSLDNAMVVRSLLGGMQASRIRDSIATLSGFSTRYYTSPGGADAATWLQSLWQSLAQGRGDVTVELFHHAGWRQPSVILTLQGASAPGEVVVLGAHLDSTNSSGGVAPGADDDASGVASLTEVLWVALAQGYRPARTVKFMAYAAEEVGLRGSKEIANAHKSAGINVVGVLQLDMTNYRGSSYDVAILSDNTNAAQNQFLTTLIDTYVGASWTTTRCGYGCSDHVSWTNAGYPASMPFEALMGQHNPAIHTTSDTLSSADSTANNSLTFSKVAAAYMAELGKGALGSMGNSTHLIATYDVNLKAPRCSEVGTSCDSSTLLVGRAGLGPEPSRSNTLFNSCEDGTLGSFRASDSNDRLQVSALDGTPMAAGKWVRVDAAVWSVYSPTSRLDLYYAADALAPRWTYLTTLNVSSVGTRTLSVFYLLPEGKLQAVRARLRSGGSPSPCGVGGYDDHDDLVFAVSSGGLDSLSTQSPLLSPAPVAPRCSRETIR